MTQNIHVLSSKALAHAHMILTKVAQTTAEDTAQGTPETVAAGQESTEEQSASLHEQSWQNVSKLSQRLNVPMVRADAELSAQFGITGRKQGAYIDGAIYIRSDATDPVMTVFKHELTHYVENSRFYGDFSRFVADMYTRQGYDIERALDGLRHEYLLEGIEIDRDGAMREFVADFVKEQLLTDEKSINTLVKMQRVPARGIYNWIRNMLNKAGKDAATKQLMDAERMFRKAFAEVRSGANTKQFSIQTDAKGRSFVQLDRDIFVDEKTKEPLPENKWPEHLTYWINQNLSGKTIISNDGKKLTITSDTADEMAKFNEDMTPDQYFVKLVAASHIDELVQISQYDRSAKNYKEKHKQRAARGWDYRTAHFSDGNYLYEADISIAKGKDLNGVYNIGYIDTVKRLSKKETPPITGSQSGNPKATIPQTGANGNVPIPNYI